MTNLFDYKMPVGLAYLGEISWDDGCYQFDLTAVWYSIDMGQLYYADDSGCSCPSPFENISTVEQLIECTLSELKEHLNNQLKHSRELYNERCKVTGDQIVAFLDKIKEHIDG